jgi:hypothetical protein
MRIVRSDPAALGRVSGVGEVAGGQVDRRGLHAGAGEARGRPLPDAQAFADQLTKWLGDKPPTRR